jgi:RNase H-fold protein (predicted Holliday junction resolvase)
MDTKEIQVGDVIEQFNCTGSSDRSTIQTYEIISVTKTLAKSRHKKFKRIAEQWKGDGDYSVTHVDERKWSVNAYRLQIKKEE